MRLFTEYYSDKCLLIKNSNVTHPYVLMLIHTHPYFLIFNINVGSILFHISDIMLYIWNNFSRVQSFETIYRNGIAHNR